MEKMEAVKTEILKKATNGKISCSLARQLAEDLRVSPREVGALCDELKIKISACELGCFG